MTTKTRIEYVTGNKDVEVVDQDGNSYARLERPGQSVELNVHSGTELTIRECGEFHPVGNASEGGEPGSAVADERIKD